MADYGIAALARDRLVRACFDALGMIFMLTAGPEEVRAWPLVRGMTAVEAAGRIHTDLARGFIKAETIAYEDLRAVVKTAADGFDFRQLGHVVGIARLISCGMQPGRNFTLGMGFAFGPWIGTAR